MLSHHPTPPGSSHLPTQVTSCFFSLSNRKRKTTKPKRLKLKIKLKQKKESQ